MNPLFDRYFQVLAGRLTPDHWDRISAPQQPVSGVITLGWPPDEQERCVSPANTGSREGGETLGSLD